MSAGPASVFLAAPDMAGYLMPIIFPAFNNDGARFRVLSLAAEWSDVVRDVGRYRPEALVIEAALAPDPEALRGFLAQLPAGTVAIVVLPPAAGWADRKGQFEAIQTTVRAVFVGPANWAAVANAVHTAVVTARTQADTAGPAQALFQSQAGARPGNIVMGTRTIAFTGHAGGTGLSTVAESTAIVLARNHIKTALFALNSPPAAVGHLGVRFYPNVMDWFNRPTPEGFQNAVQKLPGLDDLDILVAPDDPEALEMVAARPPAAPDSIQQLIFAAYSFNYGAIVLDLPPFADSMWAIQPILAANMAVLVCRPTVHDQFAAIRAYKLFTERLAAQHRIPLDAIFAVLNMVGPESNMSEQDFQGGIARLIGRFPPILATFPYVAKLPAVQNRGESPIFAAGCEPFAKAAQSLAGKLVGGTPLSGSTNGIADNGGLLGALKNIRIKVK